MLKLILPFLILTLTLFSCKKETSSLNESTFLEVEKKNMGVVAKRTATWCGPCGGWGFEFFDDLKQQYEGEAVFMAFKDAFGSVSPKGDVLFSRVNDLFGIGGGTPTFFFNFDTINGVNYAGTGSVAQHIEQEVIANSNYEFRLLDDKILVNTTTEFFKSVEGDFLISPFLIIDNQVGAQSGHDDSPNTVHPSFVANIAKPVNLDEEEPWAYKVASGKVENGYRVNLEFEVYRNPDWSKEDISFGLVLYKREGSKYKFVNAFTK